MKLRIFQSAHGDCILHESADGKLVLCDGGMSQAMKNYTRDELAKLRDQGRVLEAIYVSHIDQDHISGVLTLLEDELAWRVYDAHQSAGDTGFRKPRAPRPPEIKRILHNAFRDQVDDNEGEIEELLAAAAPALLAASDEDWVKAGLEMEKIALSIPEALKVSGLASPELLNIPVNEIPGVHGPRKLMMVRDGQAGFSIGSCTWTIVGPTSEELDSLRTGWNNWLAKNQASINGIREYIRDRVERFGAGELQTSPFDLRDWNGVPDLGGVTAPNVASLMFMVEENGKRLLLTGDSQQRIIEKGLTATGYLDSGSLHVDALKVQHHGSENNLDADFVRRVSADHYIFCGNGENGNPEPEVIQAIYDSRLGPASKRALAPEAGGRPFKFWFSTSSQVLTEGSNEREAFEEVEELVQSLVTHSGGKLKAYFNRYASRTLTL